jgi:hypothetical protein
MCLFILFFIPIFNIQFPNPIVYRVSVAVALVLVTAKLHTAVPPQVWVIPGLAQSPPMQFLSSGFSSRAKS